MARIEGPWDSMTYIGGGRQSAGEGLERGIMAGTMPHREVPRKAKETAEPRSASTGESSSALAGLPGGL
jgi:hypothetical protein